MTYTLFFAAIGFTAAVSWWVGRLTENLKVHNEHFLAAQAAQRGLLSYGGAQATASGAAAASVGVASSCGSAACH